MQTPGPIKKSALPTGAAGSEHLSFEQIRSSGASVAPFLFVLSQPNDPQQTTWLPKLTSHLDKELMERDTKACTGLHRYKKKEKKIATPLLNLAISEIRQEINSIRREQLVKYVILESIIKLLLLCDSAKRAPVSPQQDKVDWEFNRSL